MMMQAGMNKLTLLSDTAKVIAVDNMVKLYRSVATRVELPNATRKAINDLLKDDEYKTSIQKSSELYDYFKKAGL